MSLKKCLKGLTHETTKDGEIIYLKQKLVMRGDIMSKIIAIVGPTATGKTKLSVRLAHYLNAVIINADSTAIYKEPIIATAKVTEEEKENVPHYMLDLVSLNNDYTLFDYQKDGRKLLDKFIKENKNIIIVGGSGLYIKALLYNYNLDYEILLQSLHVFLHIHHLLLKLSRQPLVLLHIKFWIQFRQILNNL